MPERVAAFGALEGWSLCTGAACDVVYFRGAETVAQSDVRVRPFHKSDDPARLVCFCFGHSADAVIRDVRTNGTSTIRNAIKSACKSGLDDCERTNPQGRCCLGNIGKLIAKVEPPPAGQVEAVRTSRGPALPLAGAVLAALLASACCWLPLIAIALGTSAAGVGTFFAAWRIPLLIGAGVLLGVGFTLVYRKPRCAPGEACARSNRKLRRVNLVMLWGSTVIIAVAALFPNAVVALASGGEIAAAAPSQTESLYVLEGMSCAGCAGEAREALLRVGGVASASVAYATRRATVVWNGAPDHAAVAKAMDALGYRSAPLP
jgi:copper chaperone CopZ